MHALLIVLRHQARRRRNSGEPAPRGREVLASEAMRPSNATAQWHGGWPARYRRRKSRAGMDKSRRHRGRQSRDGGAGDRGGDARGAASGQIGGAGDAGPRAGAARDRGARPLESRIRRFRRRRADGHAGRHFRPARGRSRGKAAGAANAAGAAEASAVPARRRAGRASKGAVETLELALLRGTRPQAGSAGLAHDFARFRDELAKLRRGETSSLHPCRAASQAERRGTRSGRKR